MSGQRRPSFPQNHHHHRPPLSTTAHDDMAQIQRPLSFPAPYSLGLHEQHQHAAPSLPPLRMERPPPTPQRYDGLTLPPLQLAPAPTEPQRPPPQPRTRMDISGLLTTEPSAPVQAQHLLNFSPAHHSSTRSPSSATSGRHEQRPSYFPPGHQVSNYHAQPPVTSQQPPPSAERFSFSHGQPHHSPLAPEQDHAQYSPAVTHHSSVPSVYGSISDSSPRTSVPPSASSQRPQESASPPYNYTLSIRQQPAAARACGFGERDRRVIDPPPILELRITDKETGAPEQDYNAMLALHCTLLSPDGRDDETEVQPAHADMPSTRRLMGTLVASPYQAKDERGIAGTFFVFPDLSCRSPGRFRLRFKLLRIDPTNMLPGVVHGSVANIITDIFSVYTAKDFPGMRASSGLLKSLRRQGLNVGVKKGSEARKGKGKLKKGSSDSDDDDDSSGSDDDGQRRGSEASGSLEGLSPTAKMKRKTKRKRRDS